MTNTTTAEEIYAAFDRLRLNREINMAEKEVTRLERELKAAKQRLADIVEGK